MQSAPRLITLDMDGTLLDPEGRVPAGFWPQLGRARELGVTLAPASGRQLATLREMFERDAPEAFIAENGGVVWLSGEVVSTTPLPADPVTRLLTRLPEAPFRAHAVVCTPDVAYTLPDLPEEVHREIDKYYVARDTAPSLLDAPLNRTVKIALYVESDAEADALGWVQDCVPELSAVVSSKHWLDLMHPDTDKGRALLELADALGVAREDTAAFGDYLNDLPMLRVAGRAFAMGNAHEDVKKMADEVVGTNGDDGVVDTLARWLS